MGQSVSLSEEASTNAVVNGGAVLLLTTNVGVAPSNVNDSDCDNENTEKDALISDDDIEIDTGRSSRESSSSSSSSICSSIEEEEKNGANADADADANDNDNDILEDSSASMQSQEDDDDAADDFLDPNAPLLIDDDDNVSTAHADINITPPATTAPITNVSPSTVAVPVAVNTKNIISSLSDVLNLTNKDIKARIQATKLSIHDVKQAHAMIIQHHLHRDDDVISWYHDSNTAKQNKICNNHSTSSPSSSSSPSRSGSGTGSSSNGNGIHTQSLSKQQELALEEYAKTHMELALFILKISPILKSIRFKMVPAKISESHFWTAVFYLLLTEEEQLQLHLQIQEQELEQEMKQLQQRASLVIDCQDGFDATASNGNGTSNANANGGIKPLYSPADGQQVHQLLLKKNQEILHLQQRILQLQQDLTTALQLKSKPQLQSQSQSENDECTHSHEGKWIVEKESQEFLALDEEIKSKLRDGKEQRLRDVKEQMKFILDSDDVKDSRGKWDCCGSRDYTSPCAC